MRGDRKEIVMRGIQCIIQKELRRVYSDKRLMVSLFLMPAILMAGIMILSSKMSMMKSDDIDQHIPTVYVQNEPEGFSDFVAQSQVEAKIIPVDDSMKIEDIKQDIVEGDADLLYVFDEDFLNKIDTYDSGSGVPMVEEFYNSSEDYSRAAQSTFSSVLNQLQQSILIKRFGNADAITAFSVNSQVILNEEKATGQLLGQFIPYFVSILMFAGAMGLAVDAIAGEKERGTMASMLLTPIRRRDIALGKIISLIILSGLSAMVYIVIMLISFPVMFADADFSGFSIKMSGVQIAELIILLLCMVFLYVAIISLAAVIAKDVKTASSYISPMYILVMVIGLISMFGGNENPEPIMYLIPFYGNSLAIQNIMIHNLSIGEYLINLASTVVISVFLLGCMTKAFNSEKVMFNA